MAASGLPGLPGGPAAARRPPPYPLPPPPAWCYPRIAACIGGGVAIISMCRQPRSRHTAGGGFWLVGEARETPPAEQKLACARPQSRPRSSIPLLHSEHHLKATAVSWRWRERRGLPKNLGNLLPASAALQTAAKVQGVRVKWQGRALVGNMPFTDPQRATSCRVTRCNTLLCCTCTLRFSCADLLCSFPHSGIVTRAPRGSAGQCHGQGESQAARRDRRPAPAPLLPDPVQGLGTPGCPFHL